MIKPIVEMSSATAGSEGLEPGPESPARRQEALGQLYHSPGSALVACGEHGNWVVPPGKVLWMAPGVTHRVRCLGGGALHTVHVGRQAAGRLPARSSILTVSPLLLELIDTVGRTQDRIMPPRLTLLLSDLMLEDAPQAAELPFHLPEPRDPRLVRICDDIRQYRDEMKTLQQWARELSCDERTLHRLFVQELGMSFVRWRQQAKLLMALEWLAEGRQILNIALDLGYQTPSAFTAMFRRNLGTAPSAFFKAETEGCMP